MSLVCEGEHPSLLLDDQFEGDIAHNISSFSFTCTLMMTHSHLRCNARVSLHYGGEGHVLGEHVIG